MTGRHGIRPELMPLAVEIDSLEQHPLNPKEHDEDAIRESLILNGQYSPVLFQKSRRRLIAGHGTWASALSLGWTHIAAASLDVDDDKALDILLRDNHSHEKSENDPEALFALMKQLEGEFAGSGYNASEYSDLARILQANEDTVVDATTVVSGANTDLRTIVLMYDVDVYEPLIDALVGHQQHERETFTEVVQRLVATAKA